MRSILLLTAALFFMIFVAEDSLHAQRVFTDEDLERYGSGDSDSTGGSSDGSFESSNTADADEAIRLCRNAIKAGITVQGRHSGVKSVTLKEATPSTNAPNLIYIIDFDAHLEHDIISPVECWVYKKDGEFTYRVISKE